MACHLTLARRAVWFLCGSVLLIGCNDPEPASTPPRPIRAMRIGDAPEFARRTFPGTAEAVEAVEMSFRVGGPLVAFPANKLGKAVKKDELLAQIDSRDFEVRVRDAQANLLKSKSELEAMRKARPEELEQMKAEVDRTEAAADFARAEYNRNLMLIKTDAVSKSDLELSHAKSKLADAEVVQAKEALRIGEQGARPEDINAKESSIESLQAALQKAQDELTDSKLIAPFDGTVSTTYVENFEVVQPKQRILRLVNASELEFRIDVPENLITLVPKVTEAFVTIQSFPDQEIPARVAEIGTEASPITRTYPVKLRFTPPEGVDIRPGMTGFARGQGDASVTEKSPGHVVPSAAVFARGEKRFVWIFDSSSKKVRSREVSVLNTTPFGLNVSGVEIEEWVVTAGAHYLKEDEEVKLNDAKEAGDS